MFARIYRPTRTAMQSGQAKTRQWVLEYEPEAPREVERKRIAYADNFGYKRVGQWTH